MMLALIAYEISQVKTTVTINEVKHEKRQTKKKDEEAVLLPLGSTVEKKPEPKKKEQKKRQYKKTQTVEVPQKPVLYGEKWMKVEDERIAPIYEVSNFGRVVNIKTGKLIPQHIYKGDPVIYPQTRVDNGTSMRIVRILVANAFIGKQNRGYKVINIDGDPMNNNASNLKWEKIKKKVIR